MKKRTNRLLLLAMAAIMSVTMSTTMLSTADTDPAPTGITMTKSVKTVTKGKTFEVNAKVRPADAEDDNIKWKIVSGTSVVKFSGDRTGDDADLKALKTGTAKLCCYVKGTKIKAYMTIKVKKATTNKVTYIGKAKAKAIALKHAGAKSSQARYLECSFEKDDGIAVYEVEFDYNGMEYDYEINAKTGKIIEWEADRD